MLYHEIKYSKKNEHSVFVLLAKINFDVCLNSLFATRALGFQLVIIIDNTFTVIAHNTEPATFTYFHITTGTQCNVYVIHKTDLTYVIGRAR